MSPGSFSVSLTEAAPLVRGVNKLTNGAPLSSEVNLSPWSSCEEVAMQVAIVDFVNRATDVTVWQGVAAAKSLRQHGSARAASSCNVDVASTSCARQVNKSELRWPFEQDKAADPSSHGARGTAVAARNRTCSLSADVTAISQRQL